MSDKFSNIMKNIKSNRPVISVQDMNNFIAKGEEYLKSLEQEGNVDEINFLNSVLLSPNYQRSYRSNVKEESSIIESLLIGIPIPEVFLVRTIRNDIQIRNVMDGQHRLNAIYRYCNDKFALKDLDILENNPLYNNKKFSQLDKKDKIKILGSNLSVLEFESFDNPDVEIELFKRYNRNTKPLETQEIEIATYFSETSRYISNFINNLIKKSEEMELDEKESKLIKIYNITKTRNDKQKNHQEICVIFSILENGLQAGIKDAVVTSREFLRQKSIKYKKGENENLEVLKSEFTKFNEFILKLSNEIEYPFSTRIMEEKEKYNKYSVGISMVMSAIFYYFDVDIKNKMLAKDIRKVLLASPMGDHEYKASSTTMRNIIMYLFDKNKVQCMDFEAIKIKDEKIKDLIKKNTNQQVMMF